MPTYFHILIQGHMDAQRSEWFAGMTITNMADGYAILAGSLSDQAALYGVLMQLRDLGLKLIAVQPLQLSRGRNASSGSTADLPTASGRKP